MADWIVIVVLIVLVGWIVRFKIKGKSSCHGDCSSCSGSCHIDWNQVQKEIHDK